MTSKMQNAECRMRNNQLRRTLHTALHILKRFRLILAIFLLLALVFIVFLQTRHFSFLNYDDDIYIAKNPYIIQGFTWDSFKWAWTADLTYNSPGTDYWQPVTILSRMLDAELFGMNPAAHHLANVFLHAANTLLIFFFLRSATAAFLPSFFAACFFAVHPSQVDAVAWVTARKDVLCTFFGFLSLLFYDRHVKRQRRSDYLLSALLFALSLMSKPALIALPVLLLVLDVWPYQRFNFKTVIARRDIRSRSNLGTEIASPPEDGSAFGGDNFRASRNDRVTVDIKLIAEKWIFFVLAFLSSLAILTGKSDAVASAFFYLTTIKIPIAYVRYLAIIFHPINLMIRYPEPTLVFWMAADSLILLSGASYLAFRLFKQYPYVLAGWLWCLVILLPSVDLDFENRYMYVPMIGLAIICCWGTLSIFRKFKLSKAVWTFLLSGLVAICALLSWLATSYWQDSHKLFGEALRINEKNPRALNNYATSLADMGRFDEAIAQYTKAIWMWPDFAEAHNNLGVVLMRQGKDRVARTHLSISLQIKPDYDKALNNMAILLRRMDNLDGAIWHARRALELSPEFSEAHFNLAVALADKGFYDESIEHLNFILKQNPKDSEALSALGYAYDKRGSYKEAAHYQLESIRVDSNYEESHNNLGNTYVHLGRIDDALREYRRAIEINPKYSQAHNNLAVLLANLGQTEEAVKHFNEALRISPQYKEARHNLRLALSKESV